MKSFHLPGIFLTLILLAGCTQPPAPSTAESVHTSTMLSTTPKPTPTRPVPPPLFGFESGSAGWQPGLPPSYPDSSALSVSVSSEHASEGKQSLELRFGLSDPPRAIFYVEGQYTLRPQFLEIDLFNTGAGGNAALALSTGENWLWHESPAIPLGEGKQTLSFDLSAATFKTEASGWLETKPIGNLSATRRIAIVLTPAAAGSIFIDNIRQSENSNGTLPQPAASASQSPTALPPRNPTAISLEFIRKPAAAYQLVEFAVVTDGIYANPFDPEEVDMKVELTGPEGQVLVVPAFWYQDYDRQTGLPAGSPGLRARFSPPAAGAWSAAAVLRQPELRSAPVTFTVSPNPVSRGMVRIHPENPRYFAFDDGTTFFPVGINMGWGGGDPLGDYTRWLDGLNANGGNIIRVWMASWSFGIEWNDTPLGNYSNRMYRAWLLDQVFELAEERGVYIELVLLNHGAFSAQVNPEWQNNPLNTANGGPLPGPSEFATDPLARSLFERRLRYIAARWAYSPNLFAWEWWNEANWTPISNPDMAAWIQHMTPVLREHDPYDHLISTSYANGANPEINNLPEIDFAQVHLYSSFDPAYDFPDIAELWNLQIPGKPILFAEFGASAGGENADSTDRQGLHLHNGLWAATLEGFASPAMYWWWDSYVDPLNLWGIFGRLNRYLAGEDLAKLKPVETSLTPRNLKTPALGNDRRLLVWLHDPKNSFYEMDQARGMLFIQGKETGPDWVYETELMSGYNLTIRTLKDGEYAAHWYAPMAGKWIGKQVVTVRQGETVLEIPEFRGDLALKVVPSTEGDPH